MLADLLAQTRETTFAWLGWNAYTSARHGFTLSFPDSWQNHFSVEETLRGAKFYCWPAMPFCAVWKSVRNPCRKRSWIAAVQNWRAAGTAGTSISPSPNLPRQTNLRTKPRNCAISGCTGLFETL